MDRETRKRLYNLCDPDEALDRDDARYVDVDLLGGPGGWARGAPWTDTLAPRISLSRGPVREFVTAVPGSGLTTELRRLAAQLSGEARLFPIVIDAREVIDLSDVLHVSDILLAVLRAVADAVASMPGAPALADPYRRFARWLGTAETGPGPAGSTLIRSLRDSPPVRAEVRRRVDAELARFVGEVRDALTLLDDGARRAGHGGLVVIFDGLERLRGLSTSWTEVLDSAERVFTSGASYLQLPVHAVYTLPAPVALRLASPVSFLPMLEILDREGRRANGFAAAEKLVLKRIPEEALGELFGADRRGQRVEELIRWSGGSPREIVRLLREFVLKPALDDASFHRALSMAGDSYRRRITEDAYAWLARVHVEQRMPIVEEGPLDTADRMLSDGVVLRYEDDAPWLDLHPAVRGIPGVAAEIVRLRGGS